MVAVVAGRGWPYFDPDYETLSSRINPPRVVIDNIACEEATLIKLDSVNRHGILLEVVQALTDLDLDISKAYISSDGGWFMDVFHVRDKQGNKITDQGIMDHIEQALGEKSSLISSQLQKHFGRRVGVESVAEHTVIELTGTDRAGLLSEISSVLTDLKCNVVAAEVWTHSMRVACVVYVTDEEALGGPIQDSEKLGRVKEMLCQVMKGSDGATSATTDFSMGLTHTERRLHQMMFADGDYEQTSISDSLDGKGRPVVTVRNCVEKGYSVVNVHCRDRPKLLFDTVCTLTDMQYVVFHATIDTDGPDAYQEYYIRHLDGCTVNSEAERQRAIKCLEAAIERRISEGLRLELCVQDRVGLLSDVTRLFRENGLCVTRADVTTQGSMAMNVFYVTDAEGNPVSMQVVEHLRNQIGHEVLQAKEEAEHPKLFCEADKTPTKFSLGGFFRSHSERLLGLLRSYT